MNHEEKRADLFDVLRSNIPLTEESALSIAKERLSPHPKELAQFAKWFERNGAALVARLNHA